MFGFEGNWDNRIKVKHFSLLILTMFYRHSFSIIGVCFYLIKIDSDHHGSSSFGRSRSNSHSGKQQPKSGDGISVVQDSGFSTETSSSKETPSASSSTAPGTSTAPVIEQNEAEDELWNLLDIIHRKGTFFRKKY